MTDTATEPDTVTISRAEYERLLFTVQQLTETINAQPRGFARVL